MKENISVKEMMLKTFEIVVQANFAVAVILMVATAVFALTDNQVLFIDNLDAEEFADLYGPLANNLQLILIYICLAEVNIVAYCWNRQKQHFLIGVGVFYVLMIASLAIYGEINQVPIDENYDNFFLYQGISHILIGGYYLLLKR